MVVFVLTVGECAGGFFAARSLSYSRCKRFKRDSWVFLICTHGPAEEGVRHKGKEKKQKSRLTEGAVKTQAVTHRGTAHLWPARGGMTGVWRKAKHREKGRHAALGTRDRERGSSHRRCYHTVRVTCT